MIRWNSTQYYISYLTHKCQNSIKVTFWCKCGFSLLATLLERTHRKIVAACVTLGLRHTHVGISLILPHTFNVGVAHICSGVNTFEDLTHLGKSNSFTCRIWEIFQRYGRTTWQYDVVLYSNQILTLGF